MNLVKTAATLSGLALLGALLLQTTTACSSADCKTESCGGGKSYQSCVEGNDFVVRDMNGKEYSRCETDYDSVTGKDANDCAYKHAQSKSNFCK